MIARPFGTRMHWFVAAFTNRYLAGETVIVSRSQRWRKLFLFVFAKPTVPSVRAVADIVASRPRGCSITVCVLCACAAGASASTAASADKDEGQRGDPSEVIDGVHAR